MVTICCFSPCAVADETADGFKARCPVQTLPTCFVSQRAKVASLCESLRANPESTRSLLAMVTPFVTTTLSALVSLALAASVAHSGMVGVDYYINERHVFPSVTKLIEYHKLNAGGLVTRLRKSVGEIDAPITAGLGHAKWEIDPTDISIGRELGSGQVLYRPHVPLQIMLVNCTSTLDSADPVIVRYR